MDLGLYSLMILQMISGCAPGLSSDLSKKDLFSVKTSGKTNFEVWLVRIRGLERTISGKKSAFRRPFKPKCLFYALFTKGAVEICANGVTVCI
jgi:hypothetical protein